MKSAGKPEYKSADMDSRSTDPKIRAELKRIEWTSIKYHSSYHPACAFDFELDWIVATAGLLYEMVSSILHFLNPQRFASRSGCALGVKAGTHVTSETLHTNVLQASYKLFITLYDHTEGDSCHPMKSSSNVFRFCMVFDQARIMTCVGKQICCIAKNMSRVQIILMNIFYLFLQISAWRRKVNGFGYHILPIPVDPFALPTEDNSDPLRGPLFVAIDVDCLENPSASELIDFMEYIIKR